MFWLWFFYFISVIHSWGCFAREFLDLESIMAWTSSRVTTITRKLAWSFWKKRMREHIWSLTRFKTQIWTSGNTLSCRLNQPKIVVSSCRNYLVVKMLEQKLSIFTNSTFKSWNKELKALRTLSFLTTISSKTLMARCSIQPQECSRLRC
jgi:hypothetical protein